MSTRRSIKNLIVDVDMQRRLSFYFMAVNFITSGVALLILLYFVHIVRAALEDVPDLSYAGHESLAAGLIGLISTALIMVIVTIALNFVCGLYLAHRFAGPMKVLSEYIDELIAGRYESRRELRPHDELKPLMSKLHDLAAKLQGSQK